MSLVINFDDDPWIASHDACEKLYMDIQSKLIAWNSEPRSSPLYATLSADIRLRLKQYATQNQQLCRQLEETAEVQMITDAERERRSRQIEILQSRHLQLQSQFNNGVQTSASRKATQDFNQSRQQLFSGGSTSKSSRPIKDSGFREVKSVNWGTGSDDEEMLDTDQRPIHQIQQHQKQIIQDQDRGLDELSKIIARQKDIAENIGNEVVLQNEIIDDISNHVERTDGRIQQETGNIRLVDTNDATCGYWTVIIILFVAIVLLGIF